MARRGEKLSPQAREVLAQAAQGRELTEEHRRRIGDGVRRTASKRRRAAARRAVAQVDP